MNRTQAAIPNIIDTSNAVDIVNVRKVGGGSGTVWVGNAPIPPNYLTPVDALVFAAWLVKFAERDAPTGVTFERILERVRNA